MSKKNCCIDMWYGDKKEEADKIDISFIPETVTEETFTRTAK